MRDRTDHLLTKADLVKDLAAMKAIEETYQAIGYHVITSKVEGEDLLELQRYFPERITVFMGQSGAGKSTLLNRIVPELALETGVISESLGRETYDPSCGALADL